MFPSPLSFEQKNNFENRDSGSRMISTNVMGTFVKFCIFEKLTYFMNIIKNEGKILGSCVLKTKWSPTSYLSGKNIFLKIREVVFII